MAALTSWRRLVELADELDLHANRLEGVLAELRREERRSHQYWRGAAGDTFRHHIGRSHRQHHLEVVCDRLRRAARQAREAAEAHRARQHAP